MSEKKQQHKPCTYSFLGFSLISAIWALYLVQVHNDAVAQQLDQFALWSRRWVWCRIGK